jgi:hypothetical protein
MFEAQFIKHKGRRAFVVLPYSRYKRMQSELDDYACLRALDDAKADVRNRRTRPFLDFLHARGLAK